MNAVEESDIRAFLAAKGPTTEFFRASNGRKQLMLVVAQEDESENLIENEGKKLDIVRKRLMLPSVPFLQLPLSPSIDVIRFPNGKKKKALVLPFCRQYSLKEYLVKFEWLPRAHSLSIALTLAKGLKTLHDIGFVHGNLNLINVIVRNGKKSIPVAVLSNFETLQEAGMQVQYYGTEGYVAPELASKHDSTVQGKMSTESDVFAFGSILFSLFSYHNLDAISLHLAQWEVIRCPENLLPFSPVIFSSLIKNCWSIHPSLRPTMDEIISLLEEYENRRSSRGQAGAAESSSASSGIHIEELPPHHI
jgi:serine/threonine protein kinase